MFKWLKKFFKSAGPERIVECPRTENKREDCALCSLKYICDDAGRDDRQKVEAGENIPAGAPVAIAEDGKAHVAKPPKERPTFTARQAGQKRNRRHIYKQPYGYPIRLCDWIAVVTLDLEDVQIPKPGELWSDSVTCKHCLAVCKGTRSSIMADDKGAE